MPFHTQTAPAAQAKGPHSDPHVAPAHAASPLEGTVAFGVQSGQACPGCQQPWQEKAQFCGACGYGSPCPQCQAPSNGFDFCESCGHWLLAGQCQLCYEVLQPNAAFCHECGCDPKGLWCGRCNQYCHYDFCSQCGDALSASALAAVAQPLHPTGDASVDAALDQVRQAQQQLGALSAPEALAGGDAGGDEAASAQDSPADADPLHNAAGSPGQWLQWDDDDAFAALPAATTAAFTVPEPAPVQKPPRPPLGSRRAARGHSPVDKAANLQPATQVLPSMSALAGGDGKDAGPQESLRGVTYDEVLQERERARQQAQAALAAQREAARQAVLRSLEPVIQASASKRFHTHQEARQFHQKLGQLLRSEGARLYGWQCHYADHVHPHPNDCACPSMGGVWLWRLR